MSGINDALEDTVGKYRDLNSMPTAQQKEILRAFCLNRPAAKYGDAVNNLLSHYQLSLRRTPPLVHFSGEAYAEAGTATRRQMGRVLSGEH
jgi:hypothetical protein